MAHAAVTDVVDKVTKLLSVDDNSSISAAEDELRELKSDLSLLKAWYEEMAKKGEENEFFKVVERQIMEIANNAEDTIDSSLAGAPEFTKLLARAFNRQRPSFLARDVRSLREKVTILLTEAARIPLIGGDRREIRSELTSPLIKQENVIGFEHEEEEMIDYLRERREGVDVISITGMAGIGKTTLAWKIYMNEMTCYEFPSRIWVYASETFDRRDVFLTILKHFISLDDISNLSDEDLAHKIYGYLEKERFLLVIDDVCSVDDWNAIRYALPKTNCSGRVLVTSRYTNVCRQANPTREPLRLRFLTKEQSWELLQYQVFGSLTGCPRELMGIGEYIAKQCDGLPLAISLIGGALVKILSSRKEMGETIEKLNMVSENLSEFLKYEMEREGTLNIVASSYNALPNDLRVCFLYLGVFPVNFEIPVWTLINLWIVEGFIQHKPGMSWEESAEKNLMDLVNRNLVMVDKTNPIGKVKTCRVHVVIHAFCRSKAAATGWNLFQEIKMSREGTFEPAISDVQKFYRVCVHSDLMEFLSRKPRSKNIRSLLCFYEKPVILDSEYSSAIDDAFSSLRVLATHFVKFTQFPITRLIHLTYIALCGDDLQIPEAISQLRNLQTILVDTKSLYLTVKANIWAMSLLKHIKTKAAIVLDINQEKEGNASENLQLLSRLSPKSCTVGVLSRARNLQKLGVRGQLATLDGMSFRELDHLENLKLVNDSILSDTISRDESHGLPHLALNYFPVNLKTLTLSATYLNWEQHMGTLGEIHTLQILKLKNYAFTGESWGESWRSTGNYIGFRRLLFLLIATTDLVSWEASTYDFPILRCLVLKNCEKLSRIPVGVAKSLKKLDIENLSITAVESARVIHEERKASGFKLSIGPGCE